MNQYAFEKSIHAALWGTESWEISAHPSDPSMIANGKAKGRKLSEVYPNFPLLFKVIDAKTRLSVQVHPNEETCKVTGGEPKTEMWCALSDGPIYAGLKSGTSAADVETAVKSGKFEDLLVRHEAKFGDAFLVHGQSDRKAPDPRDIVPELSLGFARFLEAMLVKDREGRIKSWPHVYGYCRDIENGGNGFGWGRGFVSSVRHPAVGKKCLALVVGFGCFVMVDPPVRRFRRPVAGRLIPDGALTCPLTKDQKMMI